MIKIIVVSDSHSNNDWIGLKKEQNADYLIHAGDHINSSAFMDDSTDYYVDGNNDWNHKDFESFMIEKISFNLVHGHIYKIGSISDENYSDIKKLESLKINKPNIIIFGHTHIPFCKKIDNIIYINPGSFSKPRLMYKKSYAIISIDNNDANIKFIEFD